jgi:hypothetical protein
MAKDPLADLEPHSGYTPVGYKDHWISRLLEWVASIIGALIPNRFKGL